MTWTLGLAMLGMTLAVLLKFSTTELPPPTTDERLLWNGKTIIIKDPARPRPTTELPPPPTEKPVWNDYLNWNGKTIIIKNGKKYIVSRNGDYDERPNAA